MKPFELYPFVINKVRTMGSGEGSHRALGNLVVTDWVSLWVFITGHKGWPHIPDCCCCWRLDIFLSLLQYLLILSPLSITFQY